MISLNSERASTLAGAKDYTIASINGESLNYKLSDMRKLTANSNMNVTYARIDALSLPAAVLGRANQSISIISGVVCD